MPAVQEHVTNYSFESQARAAVTLITAFCYCTAVHMAAVYMTAASKLTVARRLVLALTAEQRL
eukprot:17797-Heterococcus_DN1.PRE.2